MSARGRQRDAERVRRARQATIGGERTETAVQRARHALSQFRPHTRARAREVGRTFLKQAKTAKTQKQPLPERDCGKPKPKTVLDKSKTESKNE